MTDIRTLTRRPAHTEQPAMVTPRDPAVIAFLNRFSATEEEIEELHKLVERQSVELATQARRIEYQDSVIRRVTAQKDSFQRGFLSIQAEMRLFAGGAIRSLEVANQELARDGITTDEQGADALDDGAAEIGRKFGAQGAERQ